MQLLLPLISPSVSSPCTNACHALEFEELPCSGKKKVFDFSAFVLAVMVTSFATPSYDQPGGGGCCARISFLHFVVLVMGCDCAQGVYLLFVGSNRHRSGSHHILCGISHTRCSALVCGSVKKCWVCCHNLKLIYRFSLFYCPLDYILLVDR